MIDPTEILKQHTILLANRKEMLDAIAARRGKHSSKIVDAVTQMVELEAVVMQVIDHPIVRMAVSSKFADVAACWLDAATEPLNLGENGLNNFMEPLLPEMAAVTKRDEHDTKQIGRVIASIVDRGSKE